MEIWKDIPDYLGYQVSNKGRVRTNNKVTITKAHGERHWKNRILKFKSKAYSTGYRVDLWKDNKPRSFLVARLVAFTFYEKDINNHILTVNHKDGNRLNNNLENLELITLKENIQHGYKNGLYPTKKIKIINKKTKKESIYNSLAEASTKIGKNKGYLSSRILKNKRENEQYQWVLV